MTLGETNERFCAEEAARTLATRATLHIVVWLAAQTHTKIVTIKDAVAHACVLTTTILEAVTGYAAYTVCAVRAEDAVLDAARTYICCVIQVVGWGTQLTCGGILADSTVIHATG